MMTTRWGDCELSRMMLGTVQFGLPYGVANRTGQPSYRDVLEMLAVAIDGGVNCFDTAAAYGTSEETLGRAICELGVADRVTVVTKVQPLTGEQEATPRRARQAIEHSVSESRRRLQLDCLPVVLFHRETDAAWCEVLAELRERGWLRHIGVSCDNRPGPARQFVESDRFSALQIPGNVLDQRHQRSGIFEQAAQSGVAVFLRSVYLQGLLVMPEQQVPAVLHEVLPVRRQLARLAASAGITPGELALRYMLAQEGITCVLTGVETVAQVRENLALFAKGPLDAELVAAVDAVVPSLPETIVTPSMWPERSVLVGR